MVIKYVPFDDGLALKTVPHPKGPGLKRGRPTKERAAQKAAAVEMVEIEIPTVTSELVVKSKFDRATYQKAYMREYMREWRRRRKKDEK